LPNRPEGNAFAILCGFRQAGAQPAPSPGRQGHNGPCGARLALPHRNGILKEKENVAGALTFSLRGL